MVILEETDAYITTRPRSFKPAYEATDWERFVPEVRRSDDLRMPAEIDRSRIIHCAAFRRLQGKTQIFGVANDDFFRTRLTHSLEVAQIAKGIALIVGADTELVEAISLAHDIGHPPFGHAGERALNECMNTFGSYFESNAQNLRTLAKLEAKNEQFDGLNLTRATLDGLIKHKDRDGDGHARRAYDSESDLVNWVLRDSPTDQMSFEAQIVDWADQVAYSVHDLEDGIHAGMIASARLRDAQLRAQIIKDLDSVARATFIEQAYRELLNSVHEIEDVPDPRLRAAARKQLTSRLIHRFVTAVKSRPRAGGNGHAIKGRYACELVVRRVERGRASVFKAVAQRLIVQDQRIATVEHRSALLVHRLFDELIKPGAHDLYPDEFRSSFTQAGDDERQRANVARDYIAGMTDHYAETLYRRLFFPGSGSLFDPL
jgi:dGTPase